MWTNVKQSEITWNNFPGFRFHDEFTYIILVHFLLKFQFNKVYYMKVDLQNFRYQRLKNIKMDDFLEDDLLLLLLLRRRKKRALRRALKRTKRMFWVWNVFRKREELGEFHRLVQELQNEKREEALTCLSYRTGKSFTFSANILSLFKLNWFAIFSSLLATCCFFFSISYFLFFSHRCLLHIWLTHVKMCRFPLMSSYFMK